jgi:DNA-binding transcriptional ArsR family regulator
VPDASIEGLKALAHPLRYRILEILSAGERNVGEIEEDSGIGQPGLSQQLAVLRGAGLVRSRREAKLVYYELDAEVLTVLAETIAALLPRALTAGPPERSGNELHGAAQFARLD